MTDDDLRSVAFAILTSGAKLTKKGGQFLGGLYADPGPLTDKQETWLGQLAARAGIEWEASHG